MKITVSQITGAKNFDSIVESSVKKADARKIVQKLISTDYFNYNMSKELGIDSSEVLWDKDSFKTLYPVVNTRECKFCLKSGIPSVNISAACKRLAQDGVPESKLSFYAHEFGDDIRKTVLDRLFADISGSSRNAVWCKSAGFTGIAITDDGLVRGISGLDAEKVKAAIKAMSDDDLSSILEDMNGEGGAEEAVSYMLAHPDKVESIIGGASSRNEMFCFTGNGSIAETKKYYTDYLESLSEGGDDVVSAVKEAMNYADPSQMEFNFKESAQAKSDDSICALAQKNLDSQESMSGYRVVACVPVDGTGENYSVMAQDGHGGYTVWSMFNEMHGLNWGHYDLTYSEAHRMLLKNGADSGLQESHRNLSESRTGCVKKCLHEIIAGAEDCIDSTSMNINDNTAAVSLCNGYSIMLYVYSDHECTVGAAFCDDSGTDLYQPDGQDAPLGKVKDHTAHGLALKIIRDIKKVCAGCCGGKDKMVEQADYNRNSEHREFLEAFYNGVLASMPVSEMDGRTAGTDDSGETTLYDLGYTAQDFTVSAAKCIEECANIAYLYSKGRGDDPRNASETAFNLAGDIGSLFGITEVNGGKLDIAADKEDVVASYKRFYAVKTADKD